MYDEKAYMRQKRYRMKNAEKLDAYHKKWIDSHREEYNAYQREYRFRRKLGLPGGKKYWGEKNDEQD